jgi:hypothetical protein
MEAVRELPSRTDMAGLKLARTVAEIKQLGRQMAKAFDELSDVQEELRSQGITVELELPQAVLTALAVHRREQERLSAEGERSSR